MAERLVCWIFIDALGWESFRARPLLDAHWQTRAPLTSVLGYSCACDPTILTGVMPEEHGHFSFFVHEPARSPFRSLRWLSWLPERLENHGRFRSYLSRHFAAQAGFTGYFQLYHVPAKHLAKFDYTERRDLYEPHGINGGQPTFFDELRQRHIPFWKADWRASESQNLEQAQQRLEAGQIQFAYLYLPRLDAILHHEGTGGVNVARQLDLYEQQLNQLLSVARRTYRDVRFRLISDHGMSDVRRPVDVQLALRKSGLKFGRDYVAMFDSTMARFWFPGDPSRAAAKRQAVRLALAPLHAGSWLDDQQLAKLGCLFLDRRYGEAIFLLDEGGLIVPSFMNRKSIAGMHGYHPSARGATAVFAASEKLTQPPRRLDEIYSQVLQDLHWLEGTDTSSHCEMSERETLLETDGLQEALAR